MIHVAHPALLLVLAPWALLVWVVFRSQRRALHWLISKTHERNRSTLTSARASTLRRLFVVVFLIGALTIAAAAKPWMAAGQETRADQATVILIVDASLSMGAGDAERHPVTGAEVASRFEQATQLCSDLIDRSPDRRYGLISFSGSAVIHSPPTHDIHALKTMLGAMRYHYYSQSMGSCFSTALDSVIHLAQDSADGFQVVLVSDGEISAPDDFADPLAILAEHNIPVHTVGVGSRRWQTMNVFELEDVIAGKEDKRVAGEFQTRREDTHLEKMAAKTGGRAMVVEYGDWAMDVDLALQNTSPESISFHQEIRKSLSPHLLLVAAMLYLVQIALQWRRRIDRETRPLPWSRSTLPIVALVIACHASLGCRSPWLDAHANNERGLDHQEAREHAAAIRRFERSAGFHVREQIPTYNHANSLLMQGDYSSAHEIYQRALAIDAHTLESAFNDGHALYLWGESEIDPSGCHLERTRELWDFAERRFAWVADQSGRFSKLRSPAEENRAFVAARIAELDILAENCGGDSGQAPPDGATPPPDPEGANTPSGTGGAPPESRDAPQGGTQAPLSADERQHLAQELERIRQQAETTRTYRQNKESQLPPETAGPNGGRKIWW